MIVSCFLVAYSSASFDSFSLRRLGGQRKKIFYLWLSEDPISKSLNSNDDECTLWKELENY